MTDYTAQIAAIEEAIASGTTRVSYGDKSVEYDSFENMMQRLAWLKRQQAQGSGIKRPIAGFASFSRGNR
jgi:hypothetical protein